MRTLSIGKKLGAGYAGLVAGMLVLGLISLWVANSFRDELNEMASNDLRKIELAGSIDVTAGAARADIRAIVLGAATKHPQDVQKARSNADQDLTRLDGLVAEIRPLLIDPRAAAAAAKLQDLLPQWKDAHRETADLATAGKAEAANKVRLEKQVPVALEVEQLAVVIHDVTREVAQTAVAQANQRAAFNRWLIIAFVSVAGALGLLVFGMVRKLAATLRHTVDDLASGGEQVAAASGQIASTSQSLSQGASEQAASIEEVSASMEEMTAMTKRNADNSAEATAMMAETVKQVERSNTALDEMVASMSAIKISSEKVAKINKTIDEIAFQTNILALNAAVEAARAGEAGMGFAVVADEVRNLAQRSAVAAKDTAALIEESIANAAQGTDKLDLVSTAIHGITDSAGKVKNLLDEVNESSKQQGQGIQQVSTAISQVSTVTQTAAASAEESAAASEELNAQSQTVRDLVQSLAVVVEGGSAIHRSTKPARKARVHSGAKSRLDHPGPKTEDPFPMEPAEHGSFREF